MSPDFLTSSLINPSKILFYAHLYGNGWARKLLGGRRSIVVAPSELGRRFLMWRIVRYLGLNVTRNTGQARIGYFHDDSTCVDNEPGAFPASGVTMLNAECRDISKKNVSRIHTSVFGYDCIVDPKTHNGPMVRKSDENAAHDGHVVQGPIDDPDGASIYQLVLDNRVGGDLVIDIRLCVVGRKFPFLLRKHRPVDDRFLNLNAKVDIARAEDTFTDDELAKIGEFCRRIGLDVGELDIIRNADDGLIYVLDVNKTPSSPPALLIGWRGIPLMRKAANAFASEFLPPQ